MEEKYIDDLFKKLDNSFDIEQPSEGHENRFLEKLQGRSERSKKASINMYTLIKPLIGIAALVLISLSIFIAQPNTDKGMDLASVSNEFSETQDFFTIAIREELKKVEAERTPETENLIYDGLRQLKHLETQYDKLKIDLEVSGKNTVVIYAMISNFQNRIEVLTNLLEQIENVKQLKTLTNESTTTI